MNKKSIALISTLLMLFAEFMDWKVGGWELPSSVHCIIRTQRRESGEVSEFIYSKPKNAATKLKDLFELNEHDITLVDSECVQQYYINTGD